MMKRGLQIVLAAPLLALGFACSCNNGIRYWVPDAAAEDAALPVDGATVEDGSPVDRASVDQMPSDRAPADRPVDDSSHADSPAFDGSAGDATSRDRTAPDSSAVDAAAPDANLLDHVAPPDATACDAGATDSGAADQHVAPVDSAVPDAGAADGWRPDIVAGNDSGARYCGDGTCDGDLGEYCYNCPEDCHACPGRIYYVSTSGLDTNDGSSDHPWRTIQHAADTIAGGDVAVVRGGQYDENVAITRSGAAGLPVIFQAEPGALLAGRFAVDADQIEIRGFEVAGPAIGSSLSKGPSIEVEGDSVAILDNNIRHGWGVGVHVKTTPSQTGTNSNRCLVARNTIAYAVEAGIRIEGVSHTVSHNDISHSRSRPPDDSRVTDADGIRFFGRGHLIQANRIHDLYLEDNPLDEPHMDCFQTWKNAYQITFDGNTCHLPNTDGMVKLAMIQRTGGDLEPVRDLVFKNNLFLSDNVFNGWTPLNIGNEGCEIATPIEDIAIVNNTFAHPAGVGGMALLLRCINRISIQNNLFIDWGNASYSYVNPARDVYDMVIGNNAIHKTDGVEPAGGPFPGDDIAETWMQDPLIVSPSGNDFHLREGSPLIDRGAARPEVGFDFDGNARPQGAGHDIGAFEFTATAAMTHPDLLLPKQAWDLSPATATVCQTGCDYPSIQAAVNAAAPGSVIEVRAGTYHEEVTLAGDGTSDAWIVLRAEPGAEAWIDGSTLGGAASNLDLGSHSFWKIIGLRMRMAGAGSAAACAYTPVNGISIGAGAHDILIQDVVIQSPSGDGIDLAGNNQNIRILDSEILDMRADAPCFDGDGHGVLVVVDDSVSSWLTRDVLVRNNFVHDSHGKACLALADYSALGFPNRPQNVVFEHNHVRDCSSGIKVNANGTFRRNLIVDTGVNNGITLEEGNDGFQAYTHDAENNVTDARIYNNTVVGFKRSYNFDMRYSSPPQTVSIFKNNIAFLPRYRWPVMAIDTAFVDDASNLFYCGTSSCTLSDATFSYTADDSTLVGVDPLFTRHAATGYDYTPGSGSPAIESGSATEFSDPYRGSAPEIGAIEVQ